MVNTENSGVAPIFPTVNSQNLINPLEQAPNNFFGIGVNRPYVRAAEEKQAINRTPDRGQKNMENKISIPQPSLIVENWRFHFI
jgi:hypothetical protein